MTDQFSIGLTSIRQASFSFPTVFAGKQDGAGTGFGDEIEERLVSMENDVHSGAGGSFQHPG